MLKDTTDRFGWLSIGLHWINVVLILVLLYFGLQIAFDYYYSIQVGFWDGGFVLASGPAPAGQNRWPMIQFAVQSHEGLGILAIPFLLFRVFWRVRHGKPVTHRQPRVRHIIAEAVWRILLIAIVWQVVSGPVWKWWRGRSLYFFDYFELPSPWPVAGPDGFALRHETWLNYFLEYSHLGVAILIAGVVALHAAAALKHHFIEKDVVLKRMLSAGSDPSPQTGSDAGAEASRSAR